MRLSVLPACMLVAFVSSVVTRADAAPIYYEAQSLGGNSWQYTYTLANEELAQPIYEFTVFFDLGLYENLRLATAPDGWDPLAIQADPNLPDDGFYDALALGAGLDPQALLSGFSVTFDYLGLGTPGAQRFDIIDPMTFASLFSGQTTALPVTSVPEPASAALAILGLAGLMLARRGRVTPSNRH